jgi:hypothetical protein
MFLFDTENQLEHSECIIGADHTRKGDVLSLFINQ